MDPTTKADARIARDDLLSRAKLIGQWSQLYGSPGDRDAKRAAELEAEAARLADLIPTLPE